MQWWFITYSQNEATYRSTILWISCLFTHVQTNRVYNTYTMNPERNKKTSDLNRLNQKKWLQLKKKKIRAFTIKLLEAKLPDFFRYISRFSVLKNKRRRNCVLKNRCYKNWLIVSSVKQFNSSNIYWPRRQIMSSRWFELKTSAVEAHCTSYRAIISSSARNSKGKLWILHYVYIFIM